MKQYAILLLCLLVTTFSYGQETESLGTNNTAATTPSVHDDPVLGKNPFDVKIETNIDIPPTKLQEFNTGDSLYVTFMYSTNTPMNIAVNLNCRLSTDNQWSNNDIQVTLDQQISNRVDTDVLTGVNTFLTVPRNIPNGPYYILVKLEPSIEAEEVTTSNNFFKRKIHFGPQLNNTAPLQQEHMLQNKNPRGK